MDASLYPQLLSLTDAEPTLKAALAAKNDSPCVDWWNTTVDTVNMPRDVAKQSLLVVLVMCPFRIAALATQDAKDAWRDVLSIFRSIDSIPIQSLKPVIGQGVTDGVILQAEADTLFSLSLRKGTRAEGAFGAGVTVTEPDFYRARGGK